jgi:hypothetical protein
MTKILIYELGTGVPAEKIQNADFLIEKIPFNKSSGLDLVYGYEGCFLVHKTPSGEHGFYRHGSFLEDFLIEITYNLSSYEIETLSRDAKGRFAIHIETKHDEKSHTTPTRLTPPRVQLENFIYDPSVVWYGPYACPTCGVEIVKSSRESGAIALDAPHGHHYPNHHWVEHECR